MAENVITSEKEENTSLNQAEEGLKDTIGGRQADHVTRQEEAEEQAPVLREKLLRALADAENARKHGAQARLEGREEGIVAAVREFIDVLDNLDRALAAQKAPTAEFDQSDALQAGVIATRDLMLAGLQRLHIERIAPLNEKFDPDFCEAVSMRAVAGLARGVVIEVVQPGYRVGARLIRPAQVIVSRETN